MKRIVVTGPTGAIGTALIRECIAKDIEVYAIVRPYSARAARIPEVAHVHLVECDLSGLGDLDVSDIPPCDGCLYTGIVHDTGVFKHSNTTRKTMEYAGMLLEKGVSTTKIIDETFYQKTFVQNQLLGKALLKSQLYADGQIIISNLSEQDFEELHASTSDSDGIIDQLRITKGVEAAIFLYPIENGYKVSMRSNEKVKVSEIAKTHGGGGHIRAAGCSMKGTLKDIQSTIISEITEQL